MAKFCTNCGKELKEGEVCDCSKGNEIMSNVIVQKMFGVFKGMIYSPIDTMKDFIKKSNFTLAMILIGILSVISGLFVMACLKNGLSSMGYYGAYNMLNVQIPYMKMFFTTLVVVFASSFAYTGILYLVNSQIFKRESDFREVYAMYGVSSVILSLFLALGTILIFVNVTLGVVAVVLGSLLSNVYCYHGLKFLGTKDENKYGYIYLITYVVFLIFIYILTKIFS